MFILVERSWLKNSKDPVRLEVWFDFFFFFSASYERSCFFFFLFLCFALLFFFNVMNECILYMDGVRVSHNIYSYIVARCAKLCCSCVRILTYFSFLPLLFNYTLPTYFRFLSCHFAAIIKKHFKGDKHNFLSNFLSIYHSYYGIIIILYIFITFLSEKCNNLMRSNTFFT